MRQFHAFALRGEDDSVIADDITAADRMHADFDIGTLANEAFTAMASILRVIEFAHVGQNLDETLRGAARRVLF